MGKKKTSSGKSKSPNKNVEPVNSTGTASPPPESVVSNEDKESSASSSSAVNNASDSTQNATHKLTSEQLSRLEKVFNQPALIKVNRENAKTKFLQQNPNAPEPPQEYYRQFDIQIPKPQHLVKFIAQHMQATRTVLCGGAVLHILSPDIQPADVDYLISIPNIEPDTTTKITNAIHAYCQHFYPYLCLALNLQYDFYIREIQLKSGGKFILCRLGGSPNSGIAGIDIKFFTAFPAGLFSVEALGINIDTPTPTIFHFSKDNTDTEKQLTAAISDLNNKMCVPQEDGFANLLNNEYAIILRVFLHITRGFTFPTQQYSDVIRQTITQNSPENNMPKRKPFSEDLAAFLLNHYLHFNLFRKEQAFIFLVNLYLGLIENLPADMRTQIEFSNSAQEILNEIRKYIIQSFTRKTITTQFQPSLISNFIYFLSPYQEETDFALFTSAIKFTRGMLLLNSIESINERLLENHLTLSTNQNNLCYLAITNPINYLLDTITEWEALNTHLSSKENVTVASWPSKTTIRELILNQDNKTADIALTIKERAIPAIVKLYEQTGFSDQNTVTRLANILQATPDPVLTTLLPHLVKIKELFSGNNALLLKLLRLLQAEPANSLEKLMPDIIKINSADFLRELTTNPEFLTLYKSILHYHLEHAPTAVIRLSESLILAPTTNNTALLISILSERFAGKKYSTIDSELIKAIILIPEQNILWLSDPININNQELSGKILTTLLEVDDASVWDQIIKSPELTQKMLALLLAEESTASKSQLLKISKILEVIDKLIIFDTNTKIFDLLINKIKHIFTSKEESDIILFKKLLVMVAKYEQESWKNKDIDLISKAFYQHAVNFLNKPEKRKADEDLLLIERFSVFCVLAIDSGISGLDSALKKIDQFPSKDKLTLLISIITEKAKRKTFSPKDSKIIKDIISKLAFTDKKPGNGYFQNSEDMLKLHLGLELSGETKKPRADDITGHILLLLQHVSQQMAENLCMHILLIAKTLPEKNKITELEIIEKILTFDTKFLNKKHGNQKKYTTAIGDAVETVFQMHAEVFNGKDSKLKTKFLGLLKTCFDHDLVFSNKSLTLDKIKKIIQFIILNNDVKEKIGFIQKIRTNTILLQSKEFSAAAIEELVIPLVESSVQHHIQSKELLAEIICLIWGPSKLEVVNGRLLTCILKAARSYLNNYSGTDVRRQYKVYAEFVDKLFSNTTITLNIATFANRTDALEFISEACSAFIVDEENIYQRVSFLKKLLLIITVAEEILFPEYYNYNDEDKKKCFDLQYNFLGVFDLINSMCSAKKEEDPVAALLSIKEMLAQLPIIWYSFLKNIPNEKESHLILYKAYDKIQDLNVETRLVFEKIIHEHYDIAGIIIKKSPIHMDNTVLERFLDFIGLFLTSVCSLRLDTKNSDSAARQFKRDKILSACDFIAHNGNEVVSILKKNRTDSSLFETVDSFFCGMKYSLNTLLTHENYYDFCKVFCVSFRLFVDAASYLPREYMATVFSDFSKFLQSTSKNYSYIHNSKGKEYDALRASIILYINYVSDQAIPTVTAAIEQRQQFDLCFELILSAKNPVLQEDILNYLAMKTLYLYTALGLDATAITKPALHLNGVCQIMTDFNLINCAPKTIENVFNFVIWFFAALPCKHAETAPYFYAAQSLLTHLQKRLEHIPRCPTALFEAIVNAVAYMNLNDHSFQGQKKIDYFNEARETLIALKDYQLKKFGFQYNNDDNKVDKKIASLAAPLPILPPPGTEIEMTIMNNNKQSK